MRRTNTIMLLLVFLVVFLVINCQFKQKPPRVHNFMFHILIHLTAWKVLIDKIRHVYIFFAFGCNKRWYEQYWYLCLVTFRHTQLHRLADPANVWSELPGVSILKPLMGVDPLLEANLESHFLLDYPKVRVYLFVYRANMPEI